MSKNIVLKVAVILGIFFAATGFTTYKKIQKSEETVISAWADLDSNLQQRAELISNLITTMKNHTAQESQTIDALEESRVKALAVQLDARQIADANQIDKFVVVQEELQNSLANLLAVVQKYPDLHANQNFLDLQHQLDGTQSKINFSVQNVNAVTNQFNQTIAKLPGAAVNKLFLHLPQKQLFAASAVAPIADVAPVAAAETNATVETVSAAEMTSTTEPLVANAEVTKQS